MQHGDVAKDIISLIEASLKFALETLQLPPTKSRELKIELEIPKDKTHGDLSTNVAMKACKRIIPPQDPVLFAETIKKKALERLPHSNLKDIIDEIEVRPPGFINFFLSKKFLYKVLLEIQREKENFGRSAIGRGAKIQVEFVSANPTGPLTIAHGRQAAIGDSLANILEFVGYDVRREYYVNDEGTQIDILANSIRARYLELFGVEEPLPQDGYKGSYIVEAAQAFKKRFGKKFLKSKELKYFRTFGLRWMLNDIKKDLKDFNVRFDTWYSQASLTKSGKVDKAIKTLKKKGYIYDKDDAVWFKAKELGDDKDRVVVKSDSSITYIASDIAYHRDKYRRGFKRIIDIWGPDHHGYIPRLKAAVKALGYNEDSLSVLIVQLATLIKGGEAVRMSTRSGEFVTLREIMDEVGKDASRFTFLMRRLSSHLDFDLDAVKKQSLENPVYYIQYAHARIWSILEHGRKERFSSTRFDPEFLKEEEELELLRYLRRFDFVVSLSARSLEPYIILQYLQELAAIFHSFYTKHRVLSDDPDMTRARLVMVDCVRMVLANGLRLLGVSFPKKM